MSDTGYVFWCTPCAKRHAGECAPKPKVKPDVEVRVGTTWHSQVKYGDKDTWRYANGPYNILTIQGTTVRIGGWGATFHYDAKYFTEAGAPINEGSLGPDDKWLRFVPGEG